MRQSPLGQVLLNDKYNCDLLDGGGVFMKFGDEI